MWTKKKLTWSFLWGSNRGPVKTHLTWEKKQHLSMAGKFYGQRLSKLFNYTHQFHLNAIKLLNIKFHWWGDEKKTFDEWWSSKKLRQIAKHFVNQFEREWFQMDLFRVFPSSHSRVLSRSVLVSHSPVKEIFPSVENLGSYVKIVIKIEIYMQQIFHIPLRTPVMCCHL